MLHKMHFALVAEAFVSMESSYEMSQGLGIDYLVLSAVAAVVVAVGCDSLHLSHTSSHLPHWCSKPLEAPVVVGMTLMDAPCLRSQRLEIA